MAEQLAALKKAFEPFDSDEVGAVSAEYLAGIITKLGQTPPPIEVLQGFVKLVDGEKAAVANHAEKMKQSRVEAVGEPADGNSQTFTGVTGGAALRTTFQIEHLKEAKTTWDLWTTSASKYAERPAIGQRDGDGPYTWETYAAINTRVNNIGSGLIDLGLKPKQFVGIMLNTSPEWLMFEYALWRHAMCPCTLYATFGVEAMKFIVNHAQLDCVLTSADKLKMALELGSDCPTLKTVIVVGDIPADIENPNNLKLISFADVEKNGAAKPAEPNPPAPGDNCLLIYTSGTTGDPKGVQHIHSGFISCMAASIEHFPLVETDVHLAFLPLAHIMEQFIEGLIVTAGGCSGYWRGDIRKLTEDIAALKPTIFIGVPRLLNRFYSKIQSGFAAAEGAKKALISWALESKKQSLARGRYRSFWDLIVFNKAAEALGGRVRLVATGSAPIEPSMLEFFRICFSCPVTEGYGMTEVLVVSCVPLYDTQTRSNVGPPFPSVQIKLEDVPEMEYTSKDKPYPRGEVLFRGPMNMVGYHNDPEKTKATIDADGWLHSGDIGQFLPDGHLQIIDRRKNIFKLSQGEYVAPEKIEQLLVKSPYVAQIFVNGDSLHSCLVAFVVPDPESLPALAKELGVEPDAAALMANPDLPAFLQKHLDTLARAHKVNGFEIPKAVHLVGQDLAELGLLTPTFKLQRIKARKHFQEQTDKMYAALGE